MTFYFFGRKTELNDGRSFVVLKTTPKTDKAPCTAGVEYQLALPKSVQDSLPFTIEVGESYSVRADEWWLDTREGKPSNLLHGKNLVIKPFVKQESKTESVEEGE